MPSSRRTPAAAQTPAGGYGIRPYGRRRMPRPTGKPRPPVTTNLCRGRCLHCARRRVSEANRAAGPALRPEIVPGTPRWRKVSREGHGPPLQTTENDRPNRTAATTQATVGRDALIPPHPRGGANARGRIWNPPLRTTANGAANRENAAANPGNRGPALQQTPVGDDARIVPRTRGGANTRGRDKSRPYDRRKARTQPGNGNPAAPQPPVGDDACTAPAGAFRRPTGPQARLLGRRSSREPCGGARPRAG